MKQQEEIPATISDSMEYDEILDSWENHVKVSAKAYIYALCDALRRKHTLYTHKDIQRHVMRDVLDRQLCTKGTVYQSWPEWVRREYIQDGQHSKFEHDSNSETIKNQQIIEDYEAVDEGIKVKTEPEEGDEPATYEPLGIHQAPAAEMPTPIALYEDVVTYADKLWSSLISTNIHKPKKLIPAQTSDPLLDFIKPSRKLWLRTLKGLDQPRVSHMLMCLVWINMLIQDRLKEAKEINKERAEIQK